MTVIAGIIPAITAYIGSVLINVVVNAIANRAQHKPDITSLTVPIPFGKLQSPV